MFLCCLIKTHLSFENSLTKNSSVVTEKMYKNQKGKKSTLITPEEIRFEVCFTWENSLYR